MVNEIFQSEGHPESFAGWMVAKDRICRPHRLPIFLKYLFQQDLQPWHRPCRVAGDPALGRARITRMTAPRGSGAPAPRGLAARTHGEPADGENSPGRTV